MSGAERSNELDMFLHVHLYCKQSCEENLEQVLAPKGHECQMKRGQGFVNSLLDCGWGGLTRGNLCDVTIRCTSQCSNIT